MAGGMDYLPDGRLLMSSSGGTSTGGRIVISLLRPEVATRVVRVSR